ncbi:MAG: ribonuclease E inhibitor RraB [Planctomycetaceae bacterium]|jgi:hypothetical protein
MHDHAGDEELLGVLERLGVDLHKPREINFLFVMSSSEGAAQVSQSLTKTGFDSEVSELPVSWLARLLGRKRWTVSATRQMPLDRNVIRALTTQFSGLAAAAGGVYDGWEANVADAQIDPDQLTTGS